MLTIITNHLTGFPVNRPFTLILVCSFALSCTPSLLTQRHPLLNRPVAAGETIRIDSGHLGERLPVPHSGQVTLVYFWGSFCPPCFEQLPRLEILWQRIRHLPVKFIAVSIDLDRGNAIAALDRLGVSFPVVWDSSWAARRAFGVGAQIPRLFVVDRHGSVRLFFGGKASKADDGKKRLDTIERAIRELTR